MSLRFELVIHLWGQLFDPIFQIFIVFSELRSVSSFIFQKFSVQRFEFTLQFMEWPLGAPSGTFTYVHPIKHFGQSCLSVAFLQLTLPLDSILFTFNMFQPFLKAVIVIKSFLRHLIFKFHVYHFWSKKVKLLLWDAVHELLRRWVLGVLVAFAQRHDW